MVRSFDSSCNSSPKTKWDNECATSNIEKIEQRTKASIVKLKDILYKVKSPPCETSIMKPHDLDELCTSHHEAFKIDHRLQHLKDMGLLKESPKGMKCSPHSGSKDATTKELNFPEAFMQYDALTSTTTTIKLHGNKKEITVTIIASVKGPTDENAVQEPLEKSIIMAAQALARSATMLEKKANTMTLTSNLKSTYDKDTEIDKPIHEKHEHERIVFELEKFKIIEGKQVRKGYYAGTPFRPIYKVKLESPNGSTIEALLKPATSEDVHCRWGNASSDWVAYKVGYLLGTDMVPPAAMRKDVKVGEKSFSLATLMHFVPHVKPLTQLSLQEWGGELPVVFVSNTHILDALLGSCPRARNMFMEGPSWTQSRARQAMLLDHPMGPGQGKLHPMWTQHGQICGLKCVSKSTLTHLRSLNKTILTKALGKWVSTIEIDRILERLEQVLAYFDEMAQYGNRSLVVV